MTMEPTDRLNEFLDGDPAADQSPSHAEVPPAELAQHLLVAGILRHLLGSNEGHLDRQIGRAMATIEAMEARRHSMRRWIGWSLSAAAVVLIAFFVALQRPEDLMATVDRVVQAAQADVDRQFAVHVLRDEDSLLVDQPESQLSVRGSPKFAVMIPLPEGDAWLGTDGEEFWAVPHIEMLPVFTFPFRDKDRMLLLRAEPKGSALLTSAIGN